MVAFNERLSLAGLTLGATTLVVFELYLAKAGVAGMPSKELLVAWAYSSALARGQVGPWGGVAATHSRAVGVGVWWCGGPTRVGFRSSTLTRACTGEQVGSQLVVRCVTESVVQVSREGTDSRFFWKSWWRGRGHS